MKKITFLALLLVSIILSATSCNEKKEKTTASAQQTPQQTQPTTVDTPATNTTTTQTNTVTPPSEGGKVIVLTTESFKQKIFNYEIDKEWNYLGDKPAIVDFYADWCKPCKMIEPILDDLAKEYNGKIYIYRVNVDENREVASVFGIRSIPSVLFIPMEGQPQMAVGAYPRDFYVKAIHDVLKVQ